MYGFVQPIKVPLINNSANSVGSHNKYISTVTTIRVAKRGRSDKAILPPIQTNSGNRIHNVGLPRSHTRKIETAANSRSSYWLVRLNGDIERKAKYYVRCLKRQNNSPPKKIKNRTSVVANSVSALEEDSCKRSRIDGVVILFRSF